MPRRLLLAAVLGAIWVGCGCQFLSSATTAAGFGPAGESSGGEQAAKGLPSGATTGETPVAGAPDASSPTVPDPLRDPRELRLRHVRQLTRSRLVAMPRFSADGRSIYVAEKRASEIVLLRVNIADPSKPTEELPALDASKLLWGLAQGKGGPCAVTTAKPCAGDAWPRPEALASCEGLTTIALLGDPPLACPPGRGTLPCVVGPSGSQVCPTRVGDAMRLVLWKPSATSGLPLGPAGANDWMPSLSRDGSRLVFVTQPAAPGDLPASKDVEATHLMVSFLDHADPQPANIGPEATRTLDPTFTAAGKRVLFASTADDAAGREVDLLLLSVIGGALERVTFAPGVDRYPTFSPDGKQLAWVSERNADTKAQDLYIADWVEP